MLNSCTVAYLILPFTIVLMLVNVAGVEFSPSIGTTVAHIKELGWLTSIELRELRSESKRNLVEVNLASVIRKTFTLGSLVV